MKQRITVEQLKGLTGAQQEILRKWYKAEEGDWFYRSTVNDAGVYGGLDDWSFGEFTLTKPEIIDLPLLSIGQMIEFLSSGMEDTIFHPRENVWQVNHMKKYGSQRPELCDALWETVKIVLVKNP
jgi:hypothetical protein